MVVANCRCPVVLAGTCAGPLQATSAKQGPLDLSPALGSIEVGRSGLGPIPPPLPPKMPFLCDPLSIPHSLYFPSPLWIVAVHRIKQTQTFDCRRKTQAIGPGPTAHPSPTCTRRPRSFLWLPCIEFFHLSASSGSQLLSLLLITSYSNHYLLNTVIIT